MEHQAQTLDHPHRYKVTGMDCASCVAKIETALSRLEGVENIQANASTETLTAQFKSDAARKRAPCPCAPASDRQNSVADAMAAAPQDKSAPSFEDAIKRLGEIVQKLEKGDLALEESLKLFEEGVRLSRVSQERLDAAQKKVEELLSVDAEGRARTAPFETTAAADDDE